MKLKNHNSLSALSLLSVICFSSSLQAQQTETVKDKNTDTTLVSIPVAAPPSVDEKNIIFERSEVIPSVDRVLWRRHLEKNLGRVIIAAAKAGMSAGRYIINVRFIVEKDGSISEVRALNDFGYGLAQGAVNVVQTGPKWQPGEQNNRKVRSYLTQPITFVISNK